MTVDHIKAVKTEYDPNACSIMGVEPASTWRVLICASSVLSIGAIPVLLGCDKAPQNLAV